jgi:hypothetical protein
MIPLRQYLTGAADRTRADPAELALGFVPCALVGGRMREHVVVGVDGFAEPATVEGGSREVQLGAEWRGIASGGLLTLLNQVLPKQLDVINDALDPVAKLEQKIDQQVSKFFAPAGQFINKLKNQVDEALDKAVLDPIKDAITKPLQEAIGKPISKIYHQILDAVNDTIGKPINRAIQSVRDAFKSLGCHVSKLFGAKKKC